jgi:hypothetical protein
VTLSASGVTLQGYGDGEAVVHSGIVMSGNGQTVREFTVADTPDPTPEITNTGTDCIRVNGSGNRIEHMELRHCGKQAVITGTSSSNTTIVRNWIHDTGSGGNHEHGIYMQGSGLIARNVIARPDAYGISLYAAPCNVDVTENTITGAAADEAAISVNTSCSGIRVVNNVFAFNDGYGVSIGTNASASTGIIDNNLIYGNALGAVRGSRMPVTNTIAADPAFTDWLYHVAPESPAADAARPDITYSPDRDGTGQTGLAPSLGAYEQ